MTRLQKFIFGARNFPVTGKSGRNCFFNFILENLLITGSQFFQADDVFHFMPCETLGSVQDAEKGR